MQSYQSRMHMQMLVISSCTVFVAKARRLLKDFEIRIPTVEKLN